MKTVCGLLCNLCALAPWAGVTYLRSLHSSVLMSPKKDETAVQCFDLALSVLVMVGVSKRLLRSIIDSISLAVYYLLKQHIVSAPASDWIKISFLLLSYFFDSIP